MIEGQLWQEDQVINGRNDKGKNARGRKSKDKMGEDEVSLKYSRILKMLNMFNTGVASHTKAGHLIELKYVPILKI